MQIKILLVFLSIILIQSCSLFDNDSYTPSYLVFEEATLTTRFDEGDPVHDIKDVWVYTDDNLVGIFPIPGKVPIIPTGKDIELLISAGVKENGDINSSSEYPFFKRISTSIKGEPGKEYKIPLTFSYIEDAKFDIVEGFEGSNQVLIKDIDENIETRISLTEDDKVSGKKSGVAIINNANQVFKASTANYYSNAQNARGSVFIEFDYKADENLYVGTDLITNSEKISEYKVILVKNDEWKRAYINISNEISDPDVNLYTITFGAFYDSKSGEDSKIYIDNLKLIHF